jgi:16S rRNA (guanine1516-N2)-methyltransferase
MQFFENSVAVSIDSIMTRFPYLSHVIELHQDLDIDFELEDDIIKLRSPYSNPVCTNVRGELDYHTKFFFKNSLHKEPLARAIGLKKGQPKPFVLDATAGMLSDSLLLYSFGCKVHAFERHPVAFILSANAIYNHGLDLDISFGDVSEADIDVDCVYFDPMYALKNEKTLPKKEMRIFREVVGVDGDAKSVAEKLREKSKRLVVKRSIKGKPLLENPNMTVKGKSTAYDIYLK